MKEGVDCRIEKIYFNTTKVLFKLCRCHVSWRRDRHFNTTKVLFKRGSTCGTRQSCRWFQYYKSTLQTQTFAATLLRMTPISILQKYSSNIIKKTIFSVIFSEFQYYKSTLQTSAAAEEDKPQGSVISILQKYSSNLIAAGYNQSWWSTFQYYKSTLQTWHHSIYILQSCDISILQKYSSNLTRPRDGRDDDSLHFNTTKVLFKHMRHGKERGHDGIISILQKYSSNFIFSSPPLF